MTLKLNNSVVSVAHVPSVARFFCDRFGQWDGQCRVDPEPPIDPAAPTGEPLGDGGLKALQTEREQRRQAENRARQLEAQLKAFEGVDPLKYQEAIRIAEQQQQFAEQQAQWKAQQEAELKQKYEPQIKQQQEIAAKAQQELQLFQQDVYLEREFLRAEGFPDSYKRVAPDLRSRTRLVTEGEGDNKKITVQVLDTNGDPLYIADQGKSRPATVAQLIDELIQADQSFARNFKAAEKPGFNVRGNDFSATNPHLQGLSAWQRVDLQRQQAKGR